MRIGMQNLSISSRYDKQEQNWRHWFNTYMIIRILTWMLMACFTNFLKWNMVFRPLDHKLNEGRLDHCCQTFMQTKNKAHVSLGRI